MKRLTKSNFKILIAVCMPFVMLACKRAQENASSISIQIPQMHSHQKSLSALSFPASGVLCFMANATAKDIKSTNDTCLPEIGITSSFGKEGEEITINGIPSGDNRKFEIFMYQQLSGSSCPQSDPDSLKQLDYSKLYKVGSVDGVPLSKEVETISINIAFPGVANNFLASFSSLGCNGNVSNPVQNNSLPAKINIGGGIMTGGTFKLKASIGNPISGKTMSSAGFKLKVK